MCLSTIYRVGNEENKLVKDVARIEAEGDGLWAVDLFGERTFIQGRIRTVDLMNGSVMIDEGLSS